MTTGGTDKFWQHAGGKLREEGPHSLTEAELLSILIGSGTTGRTAEQISGDIIRRFGSLSGLFHQPLDKLLDIKGLGDVKIIRIAAAFEIARRVAETVRKQYEEEKQVDRT